MNLITISEISKELGISTRTLRYYEQIGLIDSVKKDDYAYRTYDEATVIRLQQILVLRKLRISLKQIGVILQNENTAQIIDAFKQNLAEVDDEITALSTIREIIGSFIARLNESIHQDIKWNLLDDSALLEAADALTIRKAALKEQKTAEDLQAASEKLNKLTDRDVRIIYLPPSAVAAYQVIGDGPNEPEGRCHEVINSFVRQSNLAVIKPDLRHFGFNAPNPVDETNYHGYEMWVTIPDDFPVPEPLVKKHLKGGLYAAHMIPIGAFEQWEWLSAWVSNNEKFVYRGTGRQENMFDWLEEQLNYINRLDLPIDGDDEGMQLDLLIPIKEKASRIAATQVDP